MIEANNNNTKNEIYYEDIGMFCEKEGQNYMHAS